MTKKEAIKTIIYQLKEIEDTRLRLQTGKEEHADIELALLMQQTLNLYQKLQEYNRATFEAAPAANKPLPKEEAPQKRYMPEPLKEVMKEPAPAPQQVAEVRKPEPAYDERKERLQRLASQEKAASESRPASSEPEKTPAPEPVSVPEPPARPSTVVAEEKPAPFAAPREEAPAAEKQRQAIADVYAQARDKALGAKPKPEQSLHEKLQAEKQQESLNDRFAQQQVKKNLADKLKLSPISDLKAAISLNQKIAFTNHLFKGDDKEFKKVISFVNGSKNFSEAKFYLQSEVGKIFNWQDDDPMVEDFMELVYRKFL